MAKDKDVNDLITTEIDSIEKNLRRIHREMKKAVREIEKQRKILGDLESQQWSAEKNLKTAKNQLTKLKRSVWNSDNPNIVELRSQLLLAAKLIQDHEKQAND